MRGLIRRGVVAAGAIAVVLGTGAGVASAAPAPVLAWLPGSFDFGTLAPGAASAPQVFTLSNTGGSATSALTITVTPPAFTITADHCTGKSLGPGKSCTVSVTYTAPTTPGPSQATLTAAAPGKPAATAVGTLTGAAKVTPAISTTPQPASGVVGGPFGDQATVTGGDNPTGLVMFSLYLAPNCGEQEETITKPLSGGMATVGGPGQAGDPGTFYWVATYLGDGNNNPVSTGCNDEKVTISGCLIHNIHAGVDFADLPDAVAAATAGDELRVEGTCSGITEIGKNLTLTGSFANGFLGTATLDGGGQGTVLTIDGGVTVTLNTLTITGGNRGIANSGTVILNDSTISGNLNPGGAVGGGIYNQGTVTLNDSTITGNTAGQGGGIYNFQVPGSSATVTLAGSSTITDNTADGGPGGEGAIGGGIFNVCGTLVNAIAGSATGANVYNNMPDDIFTECT